MNHPAPDLLTLLDWSQRLARGEHCAEWKAWRESSPDAAWQWPRVALAVDLLDAGELPEMAAEDVAAWLDGGLSEDAAAAAEQCCWHSPAQLAEVASATSFRDPATLLAAPTEDLTRRLLELGPQPAMWRLDGAQKSLPVASPLPPPVAEQVPLAVVQPKPARPRRSADLPLWVLISAAALLLVALSGVIGWFATSSAPRGPGPGPVVEGPGERPAPPPPWPLPVPRPPEAPREPAPSSSPPQVESPQ
ncbi:MAG TPA: hypothetical protein VFB80_14835, partial [Pirellulaceae bacterium]|nr:hypothetical protein [Pirellulaceae bacterium]